MLTDTRMVGGPGFEPGASRSRTLRPFIQKCRKRSVSVRNFRSGRPGRPELGQSSAELLHEVLQAGCWRSAGRLPACRRSPTSQSAAGQPVGQDIDIDIEEDAREASPLPTVLKTAGLASTTVHQHSPELEIELLHSMIVSPSPPSSVKLAVTLAVNGQRQTWGLLIPRFRVRLTARAPLTPVRCESISRSKVSAPQRHLLSDLPRCRVRRGSGSRKARLLTGQATRPRRWSAWDAV